jgi:hypothetical protein
MTSVCDKIKLVVIGLLLCINSAPGLVLEASSGQNPQNTRLFFASLDRTGIGTVGWLLATSASSEWVYIFEDDMWTKLRRAESAYGYKFRSVPDSVPQYDLILRGQDDSPRGTLTVFQIDGKTVAYTHNFTASRVPTGSLRCSFARRYSNVRRLAEEGESTGVELLTFCTGDRLTGLVSFHEGYWGEPTFVLLAMRNVEQKSPGDLSFQLNVEDTIVGYHLKSQGSVAFLSRDNSEDPYRVRLIRRLPVFSFPKN